MTSMADDSSVVRLFRIVKSCGTKARVVQRAAATPVSVGHGIEVTGVLLSPRVAPERGAVQ
jgi:hypothetical protein